MYIYTACNSKSRTRVHIMREHTITQTALRIFYNGWKQFGMTNTRATELCSGAPKNILGQNLLHSQHS